MNLPLYISIMVVCVILSAYFSATEMAFSTINRARLKTLQEKGNKRADLVLKLSDEYEKLLSTTLIGNNIVNTLLAAIGTLVFTYLIANEATATTVSTAVITVVVLIFGEITPKNIAKNRPEGFAMFSAPVMRVLIWAFLPLNYIFHLWQKLIAKIFRIESSSKMSQEELLMLVEEVTEEGSIDEGESDLIKNAIEFGDLEASDILTHRVNLEGVPDTATKEELSEKFSETKFSRLLVYKDSIDNIVGVVHQKDFYGKDGITDLAIEEVMTPPVFVHKSEKTNDILKLLQKKKSHVAVVVDEYGGTLGIVTMEDILEELVGEIWDEHDEVVVLFSQVDDDTWRVDCAANFDEFAEKFDIKHETESVSLGGWVTEQLDKLPEVWDSFDFENLRVVVTEVDSHRPTFVNVTILPSEEERDIPILQEVEETVEE